MILMIMKIMMIIIMYAMMMRKMNILMILMAMVIRMLYTIWCSKFSQQTHTHNLSVADIKVGDKVRVRPSIVTPSYGWGSVDPTSVGTVQVLPIEGGDLVVDFPEQSGWYCLLFH